MRSLIFVRCIDVSAFVVVGRIDVRSFVFVKRSEKNPLIMVVVIVTVDVVFVFVVVIIIKIRSLVSCVGNRNIVIVIVKCEVGDFIVSNRIIVISVKQLGCNGPRGQLVAIILRVVDEVIGAPFDNKA